MANSQSTFSFKSYGFDAATGEARFVYAYDADTPDELRFEEVLRFDTATQMQDSAALQHVLFDLHIGLGMSYWKAYCPRQIVVESGTLSATDAEFWNQVYTNGLGEFFYRNQIDFRGLVQFPAHPGADAKPMVANATPTQKNVLRLLVPLGGGKDSLTTVELLRAAGYTFDTLSFGEYAVVEEQARILGTTHHRIHRTIDPQLFTLNGQGAYNGHVPISVLYALTSIAVAAGCGFDAVALSNEHSANIGNVEYLDMEVNHQWSKGYVFERMLREHLAQHNVGVEYFSMLRSFTEYQITEHFAKAFPQWAGLFTSCNKNFTQAKQGVGTQQSVTHAYWCGTCPKCVFVFTMLAAWVPKQVLVAALGINPLADPANTALFRELLGIEAFKPFECVGTPEEMIAACERLVAGGEYADDVCMVEYTKVRSTLDTEAAVRIAQTVSTEHAVPAELQGILSS